MKLGGSSVGNRLEQCCEAEAAAVVTSQDMATVCRARFSGIGHGGQTVVFELLEDSGAEVTASFKVLSSCCVSYTQGGRGWLFLSSVREVQATAAADPIRLVLRAPDSLIGTELRRSPRIPIVSGADLSIRVIGDDGAWDVCGVDISLGGVLVDFAAEADVVLEAGAHVSVDLDVGETKLTLDANVRRVDGRRCGLQFPNFDDPVRVPEAYRSIIRILEKRWLLQRRAYAEQRKRRRP